VIAEEEGVAHAEIGIGLAVSHLEMLSTAAEAVDAWAPGLTERIASTPYLTLFPASLEGSRCSGPVADASLPRSGGERAPPAARGLVARR
jgi:hypothetical protein